MMKSVDRRMISNKTRDVEQRLKIGKDALTIKRL